MQRFRRTRAPSFFPFLSVLLCVLGVLMFLAAGFAAISFSSATADIDFEIQGLKPHERPPVVLECTADFCRKRDDNTVFIPSAEEKAQKSNISATPFMNLLKNVAESSERKYIVFLVRPQGIRTYNAFLSLLTLRNQTVCTKIAPLGSGAGPKVRDQLPENLRTKVRVIGDQVIFTGPLARTDRDAVSRAFGSFEPKEIENVLTGAERLQPCIDYGVELLPDGWDPGQPRPQSSK